ncbi:UNVERIFIED_ORG: peptide/nickel transport system ATP-binding protein [Paenarthrobacter nicotinovorans]
MSTPTPITRRSRSAAPLLEVSSLRVQDNSGGTLVEGATFQVNEGEAIAIVGESGSGKSLTARSIIGLLPGGLTASGSIRYRGEDMLAATNARRAALRGGEICMILQDPFTMLHPMRRCSDIITENLRGSDGRRLSKARRQEEAQARLREVGIRDPRVANRYPFELSGGMRQRVAIAAALAEDPRLLIADEPSTALDATTQKEVLDLLGSLQRSRGMALLLITHDLGVAFSACQRVNVFYAGNMAESGPVKAVGASPLHPYSLGLLLAEPPVDRRVRDFVSIPGSVPTPDSVRGSCPFAARCRWATEQCHTEKPAFRPIEDGRTVACHRSEEIREEMAHERISFEGATLPIVPSPAGTPLLVTDDVRMVFGDPRKSIAVNALDGVSIRVDVGESVGIVGESGSGKSTLSRSIVGLANPTGGRIEIGGIDASSYPKAGAKGRTALRRLAQIVFQDPYSSLDPAHPIGSALAEALRFRNGRAPQAADIAALLEQVGLPADYVKRMPFALSGGERQRIAIARALAVQPQLLILDEPVSALDVSVQSQVLQLLREIRAERNIAYLFITHDLAVVRQLADRIYVMNRGVVVEEGPADQVLDNPRHEYTKMLVASKPTHTTAHCDEASA